MSALGKLAAPVLRAYCAPRAAAFARALDDVALAQRSVLRRILEAAATTDYARTLGLDGNAGVDVDAFRARAPICDYAALLPWIERGRTAAVAAIAPGRVRGYEPTSGSQGAAKRIPYNDALLRSFRALFAIWAHDLLTHVLRPRSGRVFMSVSPRLGAAHGLEDDRDYLGWPLRALLGPFLVMPRRAPGPIAPSDFRDALARTLLARTDLEIVSVWSPSYWLVLMQHIEARREALLPSLGPRLRQLLERDPVPWTEVWPRLQLVSCWTAAAAAAPAAALARRLPHATLQGKGLLATEAPITVPLTEAGGCAPLADEVFLELEDDQGGMHLLHEVEVQRTYSIIVTQAGGLLRYRLGDRVRAVGRYRSAPLLEFAGRVDAVADLVGEKLHEDFVASALRDVVRDGGFATLLPLAAADGPARYCLLTDDSGAALGRALDTALRRGLRYAEARALGQLGELEVIARREMRRAVHDFFAARGVAAGDIKDRALIVELDVARQLHTHVQRTEPAAA